MRKTRKKKEKKQKERDKIQNYQNKRKRERGKSMNRFVYRGKEECTDAESASIQISVRQSESDSSYIIAQY